MYMFFSKTKHEKELRDKYDLCSKWINRLNGLKPSKNNLQDILAMHKELWKEGLHHKNFAGSDYGMFRTVDVAGMKLSDVFLGNINGLWTNSAADWESYRLKGDINAGEYDSLFNQYKNRLKGSIKDMRNNIYDQGYSRELLNGYLEEYLIHYFERKSSPFHILDAYIKEPSIADNRILTVNFRTSGENRNDHSSFKILNLNGRFLIPAFYDRARDAFDQGLLFRESVSPFKGALDYKSVNFTDLMSWMNSSDRSVFNNVNLRNEDPNARITVSSETLTKADVKRNVEHIRNLSRENITYGSSKNKGIHR